MSDDDEERLVREVIAENPVEDVGVREEWVKKVGWHRKEGVGLRGRIQQLAHTIDRGKHSSSQPDSNSRENGVVRGSGDKRDIEAAPKLLLKASSTSMAITTTSMSDPMLAGIIVIVAVLLGRVFRMCSKTQKQRSS